MANINNYLKLTIRADRRLDDADSVPRPPLARELRTATGEYLTDWIFPFDGRSHGAAVAALKLAQRKREHLWLGTAKGGTISSFAPTRLRGVKVIGEPVCELTAMALAHESAVCS